MLIYLLFLLNHPDMSEPIHGITVSCQTYGIEWSRDSFGEELDRLATMGANWVSIHPYARIGNDGAVRSRYGVKNAPAYLTRPIQMAHERGFKICIKPHLSYWGSKFSWRGDIEFKDPNELTLFQRSYREWILALAEITKDADAFVVGTELDGTTADSAYWRELTLAVKTKTPAILGYASNWDSTSKIEFWDALNFIGVQAYFPVSHKSQPSEQELRDGWQKIVVQLKDLALQWDRPVVLTELGYNAALNAHVEPWSHHETWGKDRARALEHQALCMQIALETIRPHRSWLKGCFLWKWFVGDSRGENFNLDTPQVREVLSKSWL